MSKRKTFELGPEQLARLLAIGVDERQPAGEPRGGGTDERRQDRVRRDALTAALQRPCDEAMALQGRTIGDLLVRPDTPLGVVRVLKAYGKRAGQGASEEMSSYVAVTIYYGATAYGLVHHARKLSTFSYEELQLSFGVLAEKCWMTPQLARLFSQARDVCARALGTKGSEGP